jgi:pimeloyl-ACP methyl ester carboxylesterase
MNTKTVVFVHGMYMIPLSWEKWTAYFEDKGYTCFAPAWPGRDLPIEILRQKCLSPDLGEVKLTDVIQTITEFIETLPEKPILIGHSMGGLVVQLLLQKNLAAAGVAIDSAPPMGVLTAKWPFLRSNFPHITPFISQNNPVRMSFRRFQYAFVNGLPLAEQQAAYDRYVVPESRRIPRQSLTAKIDFSKPHPPLLLIAGSADHLIPASLNRTNYNRYKSSPSVTLFKEFPGRTHYIVGQKNWEEVANYILSWLNETGL